MTKSGKNSKRNEQITQKNLQITQKNLQITQKNATDNSEEKVGQKKLNNREENGQKMLKF